MNKKVLLLSVVLMLPFSTFAVEGGYAGWPEHKLEHLSQELSLSAEQQAKMEAIFKEQHEKFRAIHEESHNRIKEVLNAEQMIKWEAMKQQRHEKHRKMREERKTQNP